MKQLYPISLLLSAALSLSFGPAAAQTEVPATESKQVYTFVEQMPQLPGGGGAQAIMAAIAQRYHYPAEALAQGVGGRLMVQFTVTTKGRVENIRIVRSLRADCDSAAVQAVRELPNFKPGRQKGKPVAVNFTVPLNLHTPGESLPPQQQGN
jgi:protein TonB